MDNIVRSRFYVPVSRIDKAVDRLIKVASKYSDEDLAKAIDELRIITRTQELFINEMFNEYGIKRPSDPRTKEGEIT